MIPVKTVGLADSTHPTMNSRGNRTMQHRPWMLCSVLCLGLATTLAAADATDPRPLFIEGYAGRLSYAPGEELTLHVSTTAAKFTLEITRLGAKPQVVHTQADVTGTESPIPENASSHGCHWPAAIQLPIPETWTSGYYQVALKAADNGGKFVQRNRRTAESSCFFIVRPKEPGKTTSILLQLSTNTYNAYNNWGGSSLYAYNGRANLQGHRVSFQRPPGSQFANWELPFAAWAESNGYTLDYCANSDLEFHPELLKAYRLVLSVGHDEYWSTPDARSPRSVHRRRRQRRLLQWQHLLLAGPQRRQRPGPRLLETTLGDGPGLPHRRLQAPVDRVGPSSRQPAREPAHRRRLPLRRLSPQPRPVHGRPGRLHRPSSRPLALRRDQRKSGRPVRRERHDCRL
jgi:hypothetical protein